VSVLFLPSLNQAAGIVPDETVELEDHAVLFEQRDERSRRHEPADRMVPADQGFSTGNPVGADLIFRLQIDFKLVVLQSGFCLIRQELLINDLLPHGIIIVGQDCVVIAFGRIVRNHCAVAHGLHRQFTVRDRKDAVADGDVEQQLGILFEAAEQFRQKRVIVIAAWNHDDKFIRSQPAGQTIHVMNRILNGSCHCAQNLIAVSAAEKVIDQRESIDIRTDHVVIDLCVFNQQTLTVGIEEFLAVKLGQAVLFQHRDGLRGFHQLDGVGDLVLNDLRLVRLG